MVVARGRALTVLRDVGFAKSGEDRVIHKLSNKDVMKRDDSQSKAKQYN